jgi:phage terminase large subunit
MIDASFDRRYAYRQRINSIPGGWDGEKLLCAEDIVHWVNFHLFTYDPRLPFKNVPFDAFPIQEEFLLWVQEREKNKEDGLVEKSRDQGATFLCGAYALHHWLFVPGCSIGFGSRKLDLVDRKGDPDCIFEKIRAMLYALPKEMMPRGFSRGHHDSQAKLLNPENGASITGEGGDQIGRGGRKTIYFVDEASHLEQPENVDRALTATTEVRIEVSTPNGPGNPFATKRFSGKVPVFSMHYSKDPRKTPEWVAKKKASTDPVTWAQEYEIDYSASIEGIVIPAAWVRAAVDLLPREDAHGPIIVGFDVAEEGTDTSVLAPRQGPVVHNLTEWGQVNTTEGAWRARDYAEKIGASEVIYDVGGPGAGIKGTWTTADKPLPFVVTPVNFGEAPTENKWPDGQTAKEKFKNRRAEMWWTLRQRFERAYEFKTQGVQHAVDEMISIPNDSQLIAELSTVLIRHSETGKILLESKEQMRKRGVKSPNRADALALAFHIGQQKIPFQWW